MNTRELANCIGKMNPCEVTHFLLDHKSVSKYELHWAHNYNSKTSFISEQDYHDIRDRSCEELLAIWLRGKYNSEVNVCMTITH